MTAVGTRIAPANNSEPINQCVRDTIISSNRKWIKNPATKNYVLSPQSRMFHSAHVSNHASADRSCAREARGEVVLVNLRRDAWHIAFRHRKQNQRAIS